VVLAVHSEQISHMFFALAVSRWWSFSTHPADRGRASAAWIRASSATTNRATRHGIRREVAVLDDAGNVIRRLSISPLGCSPSCRHLCARRCASRRARRPRCSRCAGQANRLTPHVQPVARSHMLTLADLAVPAIKAQKQPERDRFLAISPLSCCRTGA